MRAIAWLCCVGFGSTAAVSIFALRAEHNAKAAALLSAETECSPVYSIPQPFPENTAWFPSQAEKEKLERDKLAWQKAELDRKAANATSIEAAEKKRAEKLGEAAKAAVACESWTRTFWNAATVAAIFFLAAVVPHAPGIGGPPVSVGRWLDSFGRTLTVPVLATKPSRPTVEPTTIPPPIPVATPPRR